MICLLKPRSVLAVPPGTIKSATKMASSPPVRSRPAVSGTDVFVTEIVGGLADSVRKESDTTDSYL